MCLKNHALQRIKLDRVKLAHQTPEVCCFITQLIKKLQQWSLYEVIEDILPVVLNTQRSLSNFWLLRYKQNSFGCFRKNSEIQLLQKTHNTVLLITQQPNIAQSHFVFKTNGVISSITSY